jgi:hypothetical protein
METDQAKILRLVEEFTEEMELLIPSSRGYWFVERSSATDISVRLPRNFLDSKRIFFVRDGAMISMSTSYYRNIRILPVHSSTVISFDHIDFGFEIVEMFLKVAEVTQHPIWDLVRPSALNSLLQGFEEGTSK